MKSPFPLPVLALLISLFASQVFAADAVTSFKGDLPVLPENQEVEVLTLLFAPGEASLPHRHNAHTYVYVMEGSMIMQVAGGESQTLHPGDMFYETPDDIHAVSRNPSETEPAKAIVFFIKTKDAPRTVGVAAE